jgi:hypothetical protein
VLSDTLLTAALVKAMTLLIESASFSMLVVVPVVVAAPSKTALSVSL